MMSMGKRIQASSLPLGIAAFGSYALVMATVPSFALPSAGFAVLLAFVAGFFNAATGRFFAGLTFALGCWICLGLIFGTASERTSAIVFVPAVFIMALGLGAVGFFAGRLIGRIAKALRTRRPAG
jgi:fucose permease